MTHEEIIEKLKELGLDEGAWKQVEGGDIHVEFKAQKELLKKIRSLVEAEAEKNRKLAERLHIARNKMKFGGGS